MGAIQSHARPGSAAPGARPSQVPGPDPADREGALIASRYRVAERIHAGSAGILYRAEDLAFSRPVALRLLTPALSRDESVLARLQARLAASAAMARDDLSASGDIVDLLDLGHADDGLVFVVTEFLATESLAAVLAREGPFGWPVLRPLMVRACQILQLSHQHGLLRLDLQTRHLFPIREKTATSTLKILSPGIGDVFGDSLWSSLDPPAAASHLQYAAPEQLTGGSLDGRTDIYALGVIMFELLCGRVPFPDTRPAYVCARHLLEAPPPFPAAVRAKLPEAVVGIVARALAKQPEDRWPTMRALANAMAAIDFGPCDASGVLEVLHVEAPAPAASSTSMRIDPAALHAPSPAVRPRTMPPLRDALVADTEPGIAAQGLVSPVPSDSTFATSVKWFTLPDNGTASASNSAASLAWDEILAAAEEAVAAVAASASTGTAGDSDVFMPERLLHTGEAATASTMEGRLAPEDLRAVEPADAPAVADEVASASATGSSSSDELADSVASLRAPADRSASVWPLVPVVDPPAPRRSFAWAAAAVLAFGATAGGLHVLRSRPTATATVATADPVVYAGRPERATLPASIARNIGTARAPGLGRATDLSEGTSLEAVDPRAIAPMDLSEGPAMDAVAPPGDGQWPAAAPTPSASAATPALASVIVPTRRDAGAGPKARASKDLGADGRTQVDVPGPLRKSEPGTRLPDGGHEAAPVHDPLHAAALLDRAAQASARGDKVAALRLAVESYHAQPNTNALRLAGDLACRLGDAGKARWAHRHLPPTLRPALAATCTAAGVAYE